MTWSTDVFVALNIAVMTVSDRRTPDTSGSPGACRPGRGRIIKERPGARHRPCDFVAHLKKVSREETMSRELSHINAAGEARMVDVSEKDITVRVARAQAFVDMSPATLELILSGRHHKGDVFAAARIAGIMAAKKTPELIPLCHPLTLSEVEVNIEPEPDDNRLRITSLCKLSGKTGAEMEALTAASVAALTIYDMCKAAQKDMVISAVRLLEKQGGKSGRFINKTEG